MNVLRVQGCQYILNEAGKWNQNLVYAMFTDPSDLLPFLYHHAQGNFLTMVNLKSRSKSFLRFHFLLFEGVLSIRLQIVV